MYIGNYSAIKRVEFRIFHSAREFREIEDIEFRRFYEVALVLGLFGYSVHVPTWRVPNAE
jgi:hypothetical protein